MTVELDDRELGTVLAALRLWQQTTGCHGRDVMEIATDGGTFEELGVDEIDDLCERINTGG